jgi:hypothetical protein
MMPWLLKRFRLFDYCTNHNHVRAAVCASQELMRVFRLRQIIAALPVTPRISIAQDLLELI